MQCGLGNVWVMGLLIMAGCASSRPPSSSRMTTDYNSYNEDLSSVRPIYSPVSAAPVNTSRPANSVGTGTVSAPSTAPRRADTRRPATPAEAMHINRHLDLVLDTIATQNRPVRYASGYRVQIYVGNQRQEADAAKLLIAQNFPELNPYLSYNQPTYKLKVGDFMRRIDAERYYASIRKLITSAQLQPDKIDIRKSILIK